MLVMLRGINRQDIFEDDEDDMQIFYISTTPTSKRLKCRCTLGLGAGRCCRNTYLTPT